MAMFSLLGCGNCCSVTITFETMGTKMLLAINVSEAVFIAPRKKFVSGEWQVEHAGLSHAVAGRAAIHAHTEARASAISISFGTIPVITIAGYSLNGAFGLVFGDVS